jgi:hypothetical protein
MAWTSKVTGPGLIRHRCQYGMCPVSGADTCANPFEGINTDGKSRSEACRIIDRLWIQAKLITFLGQKRQTNKTPAEPGHEIDNLGRYLLGGAYQIAFILTILGIDKHNHIAVAKLIQNFRYFAKLYRHLSIPSEEIKTKIQSNFLFLL